MRPHGWHRRFLAAGALAVLNASCSDKSLVTPDAAPHASTAVPPAVRVVPGTTVPPAALVVSDPISSAQARSTHPSLATAGTGDVVFVSLPAGTLPTAITVTIRNVTSGASALLPVPFIEGGFDPISVSARAADVLELSIARTDGADIVYRVVVPERVPPRIVRTKPPKGTVDVPLNIRVTVVFTEPIAPASVTTSSIQLLNGTSSVAGTVQLVAGSLLTVEFVPEQGLSSGTAYHLRVTRGIRDVEGDSLETEFESDFTTQTTVSSTDFVSVVAGGWHSCALRRDGKAMCWGANWWAQLGAGDSLSSIGTCNGDGGDGWPCSTVPVAVVGDHAFASLASGSEHTCALTATGEAWCWGATHSNSGIGIPLKVGGNLVFSSLVAGYYHSCGLRIGGGAYCWGHELMTGSLGTGTGGITISPSAVIGGVAFSSLSSGAHHVCGLDAGGVAYCWGLNMFNQLGVSGGENCNGPPTTDPNFVWRCAKSPIRVNGALTFASLSAGWQHTCALTSSGRAYCWGLSERAGSYGVVPMSMSDNLTFTSLSRGELAGHTCGLTADHQAFCWGRNESGQLGDGSTTSTLEPVRVLGRLAFESVTAGDEHSCGLTTTHQLYCWGGNVTGQLGVGNVSAGSLVPLRVAVP